MREYVPVLGFAPRSRTIGPIDTAVPGHVRDHLLPVLREAISNVARHALAESAEVEVVVQRPRAGLRVADDGIGIADRRRTRAGCATPAGAPPTSVGPSS